MNNFSFRWLLHARTPLKKLLVIKLVLISVLLPAVTLAGCDEIYLATGTGPFGPSEDEAPSTTTGTPPTTTTQGYDVNGMYGDIYTSLSRASVRSLLDVKPNAATSSPEPSFFLSSTPPMNGLAQTVNNAETILANGIYVTPSAALPGGGGFLVIQRQSDCSFTMDKIASNSSGTFSASSSADFGSYLHAVAGLPTQTVQFPLGCKSPQLGIASQSYVYVGQDSKDDIVYAGLNPSSGYEVNLANPGSGTASATPLPQAVSLGLASLTFNVADVNGDGINDLIAVEESSNSPSTPPGIFVFLGQANGTFANPVEYAAGNGPIGVAIDDVNGDGKLDLIVPNSGFPPNNIKVLLGNGDGTFKTAINAGSTNPLLTANLSAVATGDFNGDGKKDLVMGDGEILLGNGDGTFAASAFTLPINLSASSGGVPVVGDFNNDGKLDVAMNLPSTSVGQGAEGEVMVFLGNGNGTFTTGNSYVNIPNSGHMATEDIDGDGNLDLIIGSGDNGVYSAGSNTNGVFQFLMGRGDGTFAGAPGYQNVAYSGLNPIAPAFAVGDFNGDGKPDILTDVESNNNIQGMVLLAGDGQGNFTQGPTIKGDAPLALLAADMNGDTKLDAVFYAYSTSSSSYGISVALGNGDGTFQTVTSTPLPSGKFGDFVVGDFNGDGKPDVMVTETPYTTSAGAVYLLLGNGDGTLQAPVQVDAPPQAYGITAGDFNGDGKLDFAITSTQQGAYNTPGSVLVYLNQGNGTFAKPVSYTANMFPGPIVAADVNKDGKLDLVVASQDNATVTSTNPFGPHGTLNVLLGNGNGTFQTATSSPLNDPGYSNLAVADMNQDGIPDVVVGDDNPPFFYTQILYGKGDGTFPTGNSLQMGINSQSVAAADVNGDGRPDLLLTSGNSHASLDVFVNQYSGKMLSTLPATTTALSVSPNPAVAGQTVTFTAQVTASSGSTEPTGTINFMNGSTQLGTGTLDSSGAATYTTSSLSTGSYPVTAVYSGDTNYSGSTSSAVTLVVNAQPVAAATTTMLATSAATANAGQNVTFTATVAGPSGSTTAPTGTITFMDGATMLGTGTLNGSGVATYSTSTLSVGTHSITAHYPGDTNFAASVSAAITETIDAAPTFTLAAKASSLSITPGQSGTVGLAVTPVNGFNAAVSFACSGLPAEATCSFSPATVTPSGTTAVTTTMTIVTTAATSENRMTWPFAGGGVTLAFALFFFRKRKRLPVFLCLTLLLGIGGMAIGCGGGGATKPPGNTGTPAGNSTVTVTASSGSGASAITQTATLTLTVQ
jgi:hypothetical protein